MDLFKEAKSSSSEEIQLQKELAKKRAKKLAKKLAKKRQQNDKDLAKLQTENLVLKTENTSLKQQQSSLSQKNEKLQNDFADVKKEKLKDDQELVKVRHENTSLRADNSTLKQKVTVQKKELEQGKSKRDEMAEEIKSLCLRIANQVSPAPQRDFAAQKDISGSQALKPESPPSYSSYSYLSSIDIQISSTPKTDFAVQTDMSESPSAPMPESPSSPIQVRSTPITDSSVQTDISAESAFATEPESPSLSKDKTSKLNIGAKKRRSSKKQKDISSYFHFDTRKKKDSPPEFRPQNVPQKAPFCDSKNFPSLNQAEIISSTKPRLRNLNSEKSKSDFSLPPPLKSQPVKNLQSSSQTLPTPNRMRYFSTPSTQPEQKSFSDPFSASQLRPVTFSAPTSKPNQHLASFSSAVKQTVPKNSTSHYSKRQNVIIYGDSNYKTRHGDLIQAIKRRDPTASTKYNIKLVKSYTLEKTYEIMKTNNHENAIVIINVMTNNAKRRQSLSYVRDLQETIILMLKLETSLQVLNFYK